MLEFVKGDLFDVPADIRVNTVNCVGVMGAGVALAFKQRYPEMFKDYQRDCKDGQVTPGTMHVWKSLTGDWIINFPTKRNWRERSRYEDIDAGLDDLRSYLKEFGSVTVALPALGCGHGGLDWDRVSEMIRRKLEGIDAHVLVFEPAASRKAGKAVTKQSTDDERKGAEQLGYKLVERENLPALEASGPLFVSGKQELLSRQWIGLMPSRSPSAREMQALLAIATELSRSGAQKTIALVHGARISEEVAAVFLSQGINVVLLLPFGVLTRKAIAKQINRNSGGSVALVSAVPAGEKWNRQFFAQALEMLRQNAEAILLSDPEPEWLTSKAIAKWEKKPIAYVRYETTSAALREALGRLGARPIGRRGEDGAPNIDFLIARKSVSIVSGSGDSSSAISAEASAATNNVLPTLRTILELTLKGTSEIKRREVFDALLTVASNQVTITVELSSDASEEDRLRLLELGFDDTQSLESE